MSTDVPSTWEDATDADKSDWLGTGLEKQKHVDLQSDPHAAQEPEGRNEHGVGTCQCTVTHGSVDVLATSALTRAPANQRPACTQVPGISKRSDSEWSLRGFTPGTLARPRPASKPGYNAGREAQAPRAGGLPSPTGERAGAETSSLFPNSRGRVRQVFLCFQASTGQDLTARAERQGAALGRERRAGLGLRHSTAPRTPAPTDTTPDGAGV